MILARKRTTPLLGGLFGKRDFTFISVSDIPRSDGVWVSGTISIVSDRLPQQEGYTRAYQDSIALYENMKPGVDGKPRSKLTIVTRIDLNDSSDGGNGGNIPMWLYVKTIGISGSSAMRNMKREIKTIREERLKKEAQNTMEVYEKKFNIMRKLRKSPTSSPSLTPLRKVGKFIGLHVKAFRSKNDKN